MEGNSTYGVEEAIFNKTYSLRKSIKKSWDRCIVYGLQGQDFPILKKISTAELAKLLNKHKTLLEVADEYINDMDMILPMKDCKIVLADKNGVLFRVEGNSPALHQLGYQEGYIHSEANMGSNALGTCAYTCEPTMILGTEHFLHKLGCWAGFAAPIYANDNTPIAILGIIMPMEMAKESILKMIILVAQVIGKELNLLSDNQELIKINEMLSKYGDEILQTANVLSHEIRNSLSNISAYIQLLQLEKILDNSKGNRMLVEISRANKLLNDFRRLSKPISMVVSRHCLNRIIDSVMQIMKPKADMNGIKTKYEIPSKQVWLKADKDGLKQVFINLLENAIQAMGDTGILDVKMCINEHGEEAVISIKDTGSGIPPDEISNVFKLFYTTKKSGSGLGLSLSHTIIKHHGGNIEVESTMGQGTTFIVTLPIEAA